MKNLAQKIKIQHVGNLQKIIQMCQTMIKDDNSDAEVENLVERLTQVGLGRVYFFQPGSGFGP